VISSIGFLMTYLDPRVSSPKVPSKNSCRRTGTSPPHG
jgi:cytochrome c peroxidase